MAVLGAESHFSAVSGVNPDSMESICNGPWPGLYYSRPLAGIYPLALRFRQEPPFITVNSGVRPS